MTATATSVTAIVPTLDEESSLGPTLDRLAGVADEIVVVDGGSRDATQAVAESAGARWLGAEAGARGRGAQLALGAGVANGDLLLFVHADTLVPANARALVVSAIERGAVGGAFVLRFDAPGWRYRVGERIASWRSVATRLSFGDQAQFALRSVYEALGGYRAWPLFEDYDFARRLKRAGPVAIVRQPVLTSARRFEHHGPARTVLRNWWLLARFSLGASPAKLARSHRSR